MDGQLTLVIVIVAGAVAYLGRAAWQTIFHFHIHVIPRYEGDPLRLPWVPGPGDETEIAAAADELRG